MSDLLYLPTLKKAIIRPWFLPSSETLEEQRKLLSSIYFLVKQGDTFGERLRCVRCNNRHDYITLNCVERPFSGITGGLFAYYNLIKNNGLERYMSPSERARYDGIISTLKMEDLSKKHPQTARQLIATLSPSDMSVGALSLGVLEGIANVHARKLVEKINDRGLRPKLVLKGL